ncbi:MAG: hypothetical protein M3167_19845 [Acidobacteriota bacterium]|nr:hypothetical protein [Acidobacteriota bacterium]
MYALARALQFLGLVVTGFGFFVGVFGGNVRGELALLGVGAALFFGGRLLQERGAGK